MLGHHAHCPSGLGNCDDRRRVEIHSRRTGRMGDRVGDVRPIHQGAALETAVKIHVRLSPQGNLHHGLQGLHRILSVGRLAGEHDGAGSLVNGVRHVGSLRAGRARVLDHGIQHLGRRDHRLSGLEDLADQHLLDHRHVLQRDLYAHVAAGDHDAVGHPQDLVDVLHALQVLNLGNNLDALAALFLQNLADLQNVVRRPGKGSGDIIEAFLHGKHNIVIILLADEGHA